MRNYQQTSVSIDKQQLKSQWRVGPLSDHILEPTHGRGIFCISLKGNSLVTGSADHGARQFNIDNYSYKRELFSKKYGHTEWVTSVDQLPDGRILTAGMDSKLCLWHKDIIQCQDLIGHQGSITKVKVDHAIGISSSYDHTLALWNLTSGKEIRKLFGPHKDGVIDFDWRNSLVASGDRKGFLVFWDINEGCPIYQAKVHEGSIQQVVLYSDAIDNHLIISGGTSDGLLAVHDMRTNNLVYQQKIHRGSINGILVNRSNCIVTASADKTIKITDIIGGFKQVVQMKATDSLFSLDSIGSLTVAGSGDGNIFVYDNDTGKCLYGFGAMNQGAVRNLKINEQGNKMVAAGDDLSAIVLNFN